MMPIRFPRVLTLSLFVMSLACETPRWSQFHGDAQSQGNLATNTNPTFIAKWPAPVNVGPISYASPVVAPDGTIVIGSTNGTLSAVKPDGSGTKWTYDTGTHFGKPAIVSSAAVTDAGEVYVVSSGAGEPGTTDSPYYVSALIHLGPDGAFKCVKGNVGEGLAYELYPPGRYLFTTASPKVLEVGGQTFVFLSVARWVMVFDDQCQEVTRFELHCTGDLRTEPPPPFDIDLEPYQSYPEDQLGPHIFDRWFDPTQGRNWLTPTVAVATKVDEDELTLPIVVVGINACGVFGLEWQGPPTRTLVQKWTKPALASTWLSSPAVSASGQVVVGKSDGLVWSYNLQTGKDNWYFKTNDPVLATPAWYWGSLHVYVAALHNAFILDGSSTPVATVALSTQSASSPAVAWDRIFLSTQDRLFSFHSIDLTVPQAGGRVGNGGMSSPALDADGTVYSATLGGLEAFRGR